MSAKRERLKRQILRIERANGAGEGARAPSI
jgi:hypothetical protein